MRGYPLTPAQRQELLTTYASSGFKAAKPLAIKFGIAPRYISRLALESGVTRRRPDRVIVPKSTHQDPRWRWAIERGQVIA